MVGEDDAGLLPDEEIPPERVTPSRLRGYVREASAADVMDPADRRVILACADRIERMRAGEEPLMQDLLEAAAGFGRVVQLRSVAPSTLVTDMKRGHQEKLRDMGVEGSTVGDGDTVWRSRIGRDADWRFGWTPEAALSAAISLAEAREAQE